MIGRDISIGDPIFIDLNDPEIPVLTAAHGMGQWFPKVIAPSYASFLSALDLLENISLDRTDPVKLAANPITKQVAKIYLEKVAIVTDEENNDFWLSFIT